LVVGGFFALGVASRYWETTIPVATKLPRFVGVFSHLDLFSAGMAAAWVIETWSERIQRSLAIRLLLIGIGSALVLAASRWVVDTTEGTWQEGPNATFLLAVPVLFCGGFALIVIAVAAAPPGRPWILTNRPIEWLGKISYSLYLYHIGVQFFLQRFISADALPGSSPGIRYAVFGLIALPPTLLLSAIMYFLVERPAMLWGAKYSQHPRAVR